MAYYGKINTVSIPKKNDEGRPLFMGDYVYWVTASHRDPVTHRSVDDRKTIGRIADDLKTLMWPNKNYDLIFGDPSKGDCRTHEQMLAAGPYLAASKAADKMGVMSALKKAFPAEWAKIFALCVQWIDMEEHVSQCFKYWFYDNYCGFFTPMDPSNISRLYEAIGVNPFQRDLYRKSFNERYRKQFTETSAGNKKMKKKRIIGCDGTNNNHSSRQNELAGFGKAKDDPDKPIYGTMSYVDEDTGVTLFTHLFPGSLLDKTEFTYALEKSMCLGIRDLHLMFDRGFLSEKFLTFFIAIKEQYNITFSASCPATYGFVKEMIQKYGKDLQNADKYYIPEENVYGMKIDDTVQINGNGITGKDMEGLTLYLFYDEKRAEGERTAIQDKVSHFQMMLEQRKRYTEKLVEDAKPYFDVRKTKVSPVTGRSFELIRKHDVIQKELDEVGFFMSISNGTETAAEEIIVIRHRDRSEKSFCRRKSFFGLETPGTGTYETFLGKMFVADVAQNVEEAMEYYCRPYIKAKSSTTLRTTVLELDKYKIHVNEDGTMRPEHGMTADLKSIFKCLGLQESDIERYIRTWKWGEPPSIIYNRAEEKENKKKEEQAEREARKKGASS